VNFLVFMSVAKSTVKYPGHIPLVWIKDFEFDLPLYSCPWLDVLLRYHMIHSLLQFMVF
jgi:hypothetical protein